MQTLILPLNRAKLTASWKTAAYTARFGYIHYGCDLVSAAGSTTVWASGMGTVVAAGWDSVVGNIVAVRYPGARNHVTGQVQEVVLRYFHLARISVTPGQRVDKDTILGYYGNTGLVGTGAHLHLEADWDTAHPLWSPTVWNSSLLRGRVYGANDATMQNPLEWLHCKKSAPDSQTWATAGDPYIRGEDKVLPATA